MNDELIEKQLKNLKRKIVSFIWESSLKKAVELALFCGIKVPKDLLNKYLSSE